MANPEQLALLKQGVKAWNKWWENSDVVYPCKAVLCKADLSGADFYRTDHLRAHLSEADLRGADLRGADLRGAILFRADFSEANLREPDLRGADLREANLREADLFRADLSGVDLLRADLSGANLRGADLRIAALQNTVFSNVCLLEVKGLNTCFHYGPSTLDLHTFQKSGPLPLAFLRGCGWSDWLIDHLSSLFNQPTQFYSCFISYSNKDEDFARRLHADLQNDGVRCWFAPHDMHSGREISEQIGEAIQLHDKLLLVLSEHSMNSDWVKFEIIKAQQIVVREKRQVLFPIRLVDFETIHDWKYFDSDTGKNLAKEVRKYFIPDFSNWKSPDSYQQAFDRLLRDLKPALERKPEAT